jgi:hypothetical protein
LRHYVANLKIAGSIPNTITGFFLSISPRPFAQGRILPAPMVIAGDINGKVKSDNNANGSYVCKISTALKDTHIHNIP